jgi:prepilin-type N-terminal cleavage/methylation domain-containing protein
MTDNYQLITSNSQFKFPTSIFMRRASFTLIELLVVLALVAILSVVVVMTLNPAELLKQARDSNRLSDLATINTALNLFSTDVLGGFMGTSTVVYTSLVNTVNPATTTCAGMGLPTLPTGWTYNCPTSTQSLRNTDGTGWIPVNFQRISSNSPISQLPIDPQNTTSTKYYTYVTGGSWQLAVAMESQKYQATAYSSGGADPSTYTVGNNLSLAPFIGGLIAWWKFDDNNNSTTSDSSGYRNTGTWNGTSTSRYVSGKVGAYAGSLNGTNDCVGTTATLPSAANTTAFWVHLNSSSGNGAGQAIVWSYYFTARPSALFIEKNGIFETYNFNRSGNVNADIGYMPQLCPVYENYSCGGALSANRWNHVVVSRQGSDEYIYLNGVLSAKNLYSAAAGATGQLALGCGFSWYVSYLSGSIDDVRIYSRALSAAEVSALYNATK